MIQVFVSPFSLSSNYGPTIRVQTLAEAEKNCDQVLWLYGEDRQVCKTSFTSYHKKTHLFLQQLTEVGTMNIFMHWINEDGGQSMIETYLCYMYY